MEEFSIIDIDKLAGGQVHNSEQEDQNYVYDYFLAAKHGDNINPYFVDETMVVA